MAGTHRRSANRNSRTKSCARSWKVVAVPDLTRYTGSVNFLKFLMLLALVLWIGGIVYFGAIVAPAVFAVLPTHDLAGKVVTRTLANLHLIGIICGVVFLICSMVVAYVTKGSAQVFAPRHMAIVAMIALTFIAQDVVGAKMNRIKDQIGVIDNVAGRPIRSGWNSIACMCGVPGWKAASFF